MDEIVINDISFGNAIAHAAGTHYNPVVNRNIARARMGSILAGCVYTQYVRGVSIVCHQAVFEEHAITRDLLWAVFDYPFNQLMVQRIFGFVAECNESALSMNSKMGFKVVARIPGMLKHNDAAIVMCLEKANCRYLSIKPRNFKSNQARSN